MKYKPCIMCGGERELTHEGFNFFKCLKCGQKSITTEGETYK